MPNIKSAKKRVLVNKTKAAQNKAAKSALKTDIKKFEAAVVEGNRSEAEGAYKVAVKAVDKAISDVLSEAEKLHNLGLSVAEARDVLREVALDGGVTLPQDTAEWEEPIQGLANIRAYDIFLAVAKVSDGKSIDRRLELEEAAAKYLARATK